MKRILVAGIGNRFSGDDAFGCEVASRLASRELPNAVAVRDFAMRSRDLANAMMDHYDATIVVDAMPHGKLPGTIYLSEPDLRTLDQFLGESVHAYSMNHLRVLQAVRALGGDPGWIRVLSCEPENVDGAVVGTGLSAAVEAAVEPAIELIESVIINYLDGRLEPAEMGAPH